jgi:hypothetical protein
LQAGVHLARARRANFFLFRLLAVCVSKRFLDVKAQRLYRNCLSSHVAGRESGDDRHLRAGRHILSFFRHSTTAINNCNNFAPFFSRAIVLLRCSLITEIHSSHPSNRNACHRRHLIQRAREIYSYEYVKHFIRVEAPCPFCHLMLDKHEKLNQHILSHHATDLF